MGDKIQLWWDFPESLRLYRKFTIISPEGQNKTTTQENLCRWISIEIIRAHYFKVMDYFRPGNVMVKGIALI